MLAKLIFKLPEEREEYNRANKALDMASVLWELQANSRKRIENKFENREEDFSVFDGINACFEHFNELMEKHGINIEEIYS